MPADAPRATGTARAPRPRNRARTSPSTVRHSAISPPGRSFHRAAGCRGAAAEGGGEPGDAEEALGAGARETDPGEFARLAEEDIPRLPDRPEFGVGAVERLDLPPPREER